MNSETIGLRVSRFDPTLDPSPRYEEFLVPFSKGLTVLDALIYVYEHLDPSLSMRWSCKNVQCGTCGVLVNSTPCLACERTVEPGETIVVDPFPLPVIKDLVVDLSSVEDRTLRVFSNPSTDSIPSNLSPSGISSLIPLHRCLDCHICDVICPVNKGEETIGRGSLLPSGLVQLATLALDERERENHGELAHSRRLYDCLTCGTCTRACPVGIDIVSDAIEKLRQEFIGQSSGGYRQLFDPEDWVERLIEPKGVAFLDRSLTEYRVPGASEEVGLFVGCLANRRQQNLADLAVKALNAAGLDVLVPKDQRCCGHPLLRMGMVKEAKNLLKKNTSLFQALAVKRVVTVCPDCSFAFSTDYHSLIGNPAETAGFETLDLIRILPVPQKSLEQSVSCHNPCYLKKQHVDLTKELTARGVSVDEQIDECCGAGGGVYFTNTSLARQVARRLTTGGRLDKVVTGCPFCKEQLEEALRGKATVIHYLELLGA